MFSRSELSEMTNTHTKTLLSFNVTQHSVNVQNDSFTARHGRCLFDALSAEPH